MAPSRSTHRTQSSQQSQQRQQQSQAQSIPDNQLGLTSSEIQTLRYHQHLAYQQQHPSAPSSTSSTAALSASSQGRLLLDPTSLTLLSHHFDRLLYSIQQRWQQLHAQCTAATMAQSQRAGEALEDADAQIERFERILEQIEEVSLEFEKIRRIGEIVKTFKGRVEALERAL